MRNFRKTDAEVLHQNSTPTRMDDLLAVRNPTGLPEIVFITSYPPRECGIATYSQDLIKALNNKFSHSFNIQVCALESAGEKHVYCDSVKYTLNTDEPASYLTVMDSINHDAAIHVVLVQHEFGFFEKTGLEFSTFLSALTKPVIIVFHTVLPGPDKLLKESVQHMASVSESLIVMTQSSKKILMRDYSIEENKITVIPHGTHLVPHANKEHLKEKYNLTGKKVLSTFGLLSSGKSIETTLEALPAIAAKNPDVLFLIIGKTHPSVVKREGERYREMLGNKVATLELTKYVRFINHFLPLHDLLDYLQLTDIYLFTSKDPNQAVSGTFSYAISCGCPIISTPIPHAREVLRDDAGIIIDFENPQQLAKAVNTLLEDEHLRRNISSNGLHRIVSTAWENSAIAHAMLLEKIGRGRISLHYNIPSINLDHIKKLTTGFGMIQFSNINQPDVASGYTLDDNARALVAMCQHFELTRDEADIKYISIYYEFISYCQQPHGDFLNYVNEERVFTDQNFTVNLDDATGRAIWALGYFISISESLPAELQLAVAGAESILQATIGNIHRIHSTRAMAFIIKGLYYQNSTNASSESIAVIEEFADRLVQMYRHEATAEWQWYESYMTYANSILPEAMLCAWLATRNVIYKEIAKSTFDFLLSKTFDRSRIKVISNKTWLINKTETEAATTGEQPIDIAYTILALSKFHLEFPHDGYLQKMEIAFNWFLGNNHLHQIIYNPCTGGCYDGLEENDVNLNQGAESTVSYLMARLTLERALRNEQEYIFQQRATKPVLLLN